MKIFIAVTVCCGLLISPVKSWAETRFISDQLVVTVRTGPGNQYQILETLKTDSPVEILEESKDYVKARTKKGTEGYVLKQYVTSKTPKTLQIARLEKELGSLQKKLTKLQEERQQQAGLASSEKAKVTALSTDLQQVREELETVSTEYAELKERSEGVLELTNERDQLLEQNQRITSELTVLQEENKDFHRSNMIQWFLAGGGVFFFGWLIGKISRKKRGYARF
jgi:SH3 domain protein